MEDKSRDGRRAEIADDTVAPQPPATPANALASYPAVLVQRESAAVGVSAPGNPGAAL